jgi:hypothetical protein
MLADEPVTALGSNFEKTLTSVPASGERLLLAAVGRGA